MKRKITLSLLGLVVLGFTLPAFLVGGEGSGRKVYVISPHWEGIKYEFQQGFEEWYQTRTGQPVQVEWVDIGGSGRVAEYMASEFARVDAARDSVDIDVIFGGGDIMHRQLADRGFLAPVNLPQVIADDLPAERNGVVLRDQGGRWYGAALATFGIVYNKEILRRRRLPAPTEWADLADPQLYSWVAAADMQASGTAQAMCDIMLQAYGWDRGFHVLTQLMGNARYVAQAASDIPEDIARGDVAYGLAIDFYALRQMSLHGAHRIGFIAPQEFTIVNADPIAKVRNCSNPDLADAFIEYVLSEPGQRLWAYRLGVEGGPRKFELLRLPVRSVVYDAPPEVAFFALDPFRWQPAYVHDNAKAGKRYSSLRALLGAAFVANHEALSEAWRAVIDAGLPPDLVAELGRPILTEAEFDAETRDWKQRQFSLHADWVGAFRRKYRDVERLARQRGLRTAARTGVECRAPGAGNPESGSFSPTPGTRNPKPALAGLAPGTRDLRRALMSLRGGPRR